MSRTSVKSEGGIEVVVSNDNLVAGWDVISVRVNGARPDPIRTGEFDSEEDAFKAGFAQGQSRLDKEEKRR